MPKTEEELRDVVRQKRHEDIRQKYGAGSCVDELFSMQDAETILIAFAAKKLIKEFLDNPAISAIFVHEKETEDVPYDNWQDHISLSVEFVKFPSLPPASRFIIDEHWGKNIAPEDLLRMNIDPASFYKSIEDITQELFRLKRACEFGLLDVLPEKHLLLTKSNIQQAFAECAPYFHILESFLTRDFLGENININKNPSSPRVM